jgi:circadian clock protein KaiB
MKKQSTRAIEDNTQHYCLYITGATPNSSRAVKNIREFLEKYLKGLYILDIIDVYQQPHIASSVDIIALPLLIRHKPLPQKRIIGDMGDEVFIAERLGLEVAD